MKPTELKIVLTGNTNNTSIIQIFTHSSTWETICSPCLKLDRDFYLIFPCHLPGFEISKIDSVNHCVNCNVKKISYQVDVDEVLFDFRRNSAGLPLTEGTSALTQIV